METLNSTYLTRLSDCLSRSATNPENLVSIIQTINFASEGKTCALVRIPSPESDLLAYALDAGKYYRRSLTIRLDTRSDRFYKVRLA